MTIKRDLELLDFVSLVQDIADGFFDEEKYTPHYGKLNTVRLFYNKCVEDDLQGVPHDFTDASLLNELVKDKKFMCRYNEAISDISENGFQLDFANAYDTALDIVEQRKTSLNSISATIKNAIIELSEELTNLLSNENIEKLSQIADDMDAGSKIAEKFLGIYHIADKN